MLRSDPSGVGASIGSPELLDELVLDATCSLFESHGLQLQLETSTADNTLESANLVAVIGFSSSAINGSLLLALSRAVLERTQPSADTDAMDWSGELAQQLLGRVRVRLLEHDVSIHMTLPVVIAGGKLALPARTRPIMRRLSFVAGDTKLSVRLEAELTPDAELDPAAAPMAAGEDAPAATLQQLTGK